MITVLVDHNLEGQATLLWGTLAADGWLDLVTITMARLSDHGLSTESSDRTIWRFAQAHGMLLLTGNRNMKGDDSLEQTLREERLPTSLPVLTIGNVSRLEERGYREQCAERLVEIVIELENHLGIGRLFIP